MQTLVSANCLCYVNSFSQTGAGSQRRQHDSVQMSLAVVLLGKETLVRKTKKRENSVLFYNVMKCHISANVSHLAFFSSSLYVHISPLPGFLL